MVWGSAASLACVLLAAAMACAQDAVDPTAHVAALADPLANAGQRATAHRDLVALGSKAVPALVAALTPDDARLDEVLAILREIGPDAGGAVPGLLERSERLLGGKLDHDAVLTTFADLVPYRPGGGAISERALLPLYLRVEHRDAGHLAAMQRLHERAFFATDMGVDRLIAIARGYRAYRVELAVELLGRSGAVAALPALGELLQRPDPRVLGTDLTVPVRDKAARAILTIAPASELASTARAVLAGALAPRPPATATMPARAAQRIADLVAALARPAERDAAAANLVALGGIAVPAVAAALAEPHDEAFREAALDILRDLGPRAAVAVPQLVDLLCSLPIEHTASAMRTLAAAAPWSRDVVIAGYESSLDSLVLLGHAVGGRITSDRLNEVSAAYQCLWATSCDPACGVDELGETLADVSVLRRRVALVIARERGAAVRALLPVLADMLHAPQPRQHLPQWTAGGIGPALQISLDDEIHRLAAEAILAVAAPDDPLVAEARGVLADAPSGGR